jgi:hypothetical protein
VLTFANRILELSATLTVRCLDLAERMPAFAETLITVFSTDEYYYKTNNQFSDYRVLLLVVRVSHTATSRRPTEGGWTS